jgi:hypothetical protein
MGVGSWLTLDAGVGLFDSSTMRGESERVLAAALGAAARERVAHLARG